jgi:hypothetical protein
VVHRGPITWNYASGGQWVPLRLQCAFDYNGVDELVVELRFRGGAGGPCLLGSATEPRATWATGPGSYDAPAATGCNARTGVKLRLTFTEVKLLGDPPAPGGSQAIVWNAPFDGGRGYLAAAALASAPGIALDCRTIPLALDPLLVLSLVDPVRFEGFQGALDFRGEANAALHVPPGPLSGVAVHLAFVVPAAGAPSGVRSVSGPQSFTIR